MSGLFVNAKVYFKEVNLRFRTEGLARTFSPVSNPSGAIAVSMFTAAKGDFDALDVMLADVDPILSTAEDNNKVVRWSDRGITNFYLVRNTDLFEVQTAFARYVKYWRDEGVITKRQQVELPNEVIYAALHRKAFPEEGDQGDNTVTFEYVVFINNLRVSSFLFIIYTSLIYLSPYTGSWILCIRSATSSPMKISEL